MGAWPKESSNNKVNHLSLLLIVQRVYIQQNVMCNILGVVFIATLKESQRIENKPIS